jgi:long-chain acyl-CoA synthetase
MTNLAANLSESATRHGDRVGQQLNPDELKSYAKEHVAAYKYPRKVWFVEEPPKGPTGKILKREIEVPEASAQPSEART